MAYVRNIQVKLPIIHKWKFSGEGKNQRTKSQKIEAHFIPPIFQELHFKEILCQKLKQKKKLDVCLSVQGKENLKLMVYLIVDQSTRLIDDVEAVDCSHSKIAFENLKVNMEA